MFAILEGRIPRFIAFFVVFCSVTFSFVFFHSLLLLYVILILYRTHYSSVYPSFLVIFFLKLLLPFLIIMLSIRSLPTNRLIRPKFSPCCSTVPETFEFNWFRSAIFYMLHFYGRDESRFVSPWHSAILVKD
jgi:hypothetical protein